MKGAIYPKLTQNEIRSLLAINPNMTVRHLSVLVCIAQHPNSSAASIAKRLGLGYESVTKIVARLAHEMNLATTQVNEDDQRENLIQLSSSAKALLTKQTT